MDHNLHESLNLESAIEVDFGESTGMVESEVLDSNEEIMEFTTVEEQPTLMETGTEEIIVSDLIDEQFSLTSDYGMVNEEITETIIDSTEQSEAADVTNISNEDSMEIQEQPLQTEMPKYIVKMPTVVKIQQKQVRQSVSLPWERPIAPKPVQQVKNTYSLVKQLPLAPKPANKPLPPNIKKIPLSALMQTNKSGQTVLAQIGKQILVVPNNPKVKYIQNATGEQAQVVKASNLGITSNKPVLAKVIVQGNDTPTLLKMVSSATQQTGKFVAIQSKSKVSTPTITSIQSKPEVSANLSTPKVVTTTSTGAKKMVINSNPVVLKSLTSKANQVLKPTPSNVVNVTSGPPRTQLHQVHVPGKGIQYIRLVTKPTLPAPADKSAAARPAGDTTPPKNYVLTDTKGNIVQVATADKLNSTGKIVVNKNIKGFGTKNLIKIASLNSTQQMQTRSPQSLLAPITQSENEEPKVVSEARDEDSKESLKMLINKIKDETRAAEARAAERELKKQSQPPADEPPKLLNSEQEAALKKMIDEEILIQRTNEELASRPRKPCNCTKSQCLKLYCECFANGEFCKLCNCNNCHNNLEHEELRRSAVMGCLERNPDAFRPKIGKATSTAGPTTVRRHNKGCNCKRSGCLKNYCECYEAKIACSAICKCVGCRNVEDGGRRPPAVSNISSLPPFISGKQPCTLMTNEVIEAACQCLLAAAAPDMSNTCPAPVDAVSNVLTEFARCLAEIISSAQHARITETEI